VIHDKYIENYKTLHFIHSSSWEINYIPLLYQTQANFKFKFITSPLIRCSEDDPCTILVNRFNVPSPNSNTAVTDALQNTGSND
jgi:hypothetical protein